jgi:ABC-type transport system involved in multi-copper enzyme maturation permease subunit
MTTTAAPFTSTVQPEHRPGIWGVARSEWTKLRSLRSTLYTLVVTLGMTVGLGALFALGRTSGRDRIPPDFNPAGFPLNGMYLSQLAIGVLGVLVITAEYSSGMIRTTFTAIPQRGLLLGVKAGVFAAVTLLVSLLTTFATFFLSQLILNRGGRHLGVTIGAPHSLRIVVGAALYLTLCGLLGVALGALLRSTAAAITALTGLLFVLPILAAFLPLSWHRDAIAKWIPSNAGFQILERAGTPGNFGPWTGLAVLAGWVAVTFAVSLVLLRRRDV